MSTTQTARPTITASAPMGESSAGSNTPAPTKDATNPSHASSGRAQISRPTNQAPPPKLGASAGSQTPAPTTAQTAPMAAPSGRDQTYTAICERVGDWWEITVPELDSVTQAERLDDVEDTVRDLVALMAGVAPETIAIDVQTSPQAKISATPRPVSPAGSKTGRDQTTSGAQRGGVSAPNFPGDQIRIGIHVPDVAGDQDQPTANIGTSPTRVSPSADSPPPADKSDTAPRPVSPQVGDSFLVLAAEVVDDLEAVRKANVNRLRQLTRAVADSDGAERGFGLTLENPDVARLAAMVQSLLCDDKLLIKELGVEKRRKTAGCCLEHDAIRNLERLMRANPLGPWIKATNGVGEKQAARLLGAIGDPYIRPELTHEDGTVEPSRPRTVSELWAYCGYKPGQRRRKGIRSNWSATAKSRAFLIAQSMLQAGNRETYDVRKAATEGRLHAEECVRCGPSGKPAPPGSPWSDGHRHADALRVVSKKAVLGELWRESKRLHEGSA